jgi:GNAT superfamily N-acetyltransferase
MSNEICIQEGLPDHLVLDGTALYCQAFLEKLSPFLGAAVHAVPFLASSVVPDRAFIATLGEQIVGIAGFKVGGKGLFEPSYRQFKNAYGWSAPLRYFGLALMDRAEDPNALLMDGIAVAENARGHGIGTRLLEAIENHARALSRSSIRLDVIDTNPRARSLYERFGFKAGPTAHLGPLRLLLPFTSSTTMTKTL